MTALGALRHRLAHLLGWQRGRVVARTVHIGNLYRVEVAFRCETCGQTTPWKPASTVKLGA